MLDTAAILRVGDPSTVPIRDCRFFDVQPFARCYVTFEYEEGACPIYEEFTFNDQGETTFIEAWSDLPGLNATADPDDRWAEGSAVHRLSTRIPGLGNATGRIDLDSPAMAAAAAADPEVAPVDYGLTTNIESYNLFVIAFHEWQAMFADVAAAEGWRGRIGYLVAPPGWREDGRGKTARALRQQALATR